MRKAKKPIKEAMKMKYRKIVKAVVEGGNIGEAIHNEGYGDSLAKNPSKITNTKTFQELLDEYMPEEFVLDQHKRLYSEHRHIKQVRLETTDDTEIKEACKGYENVSTIKHEDEGYTLLIINEVDREARKSAVELSHRIRGSFAPTRIEVKREYEDMPDEELMALLKARE